MFSRIVSIFKGMMNKGLSKLETPEILAEQAQGELEDRVKKLKEAVITGMTSQKALEKQLKDGEGKRSEWQKRAELAIQQGNDQVAKQCLEKRREIEEERARLESQLEQQSNANQGLRSQLATAESELRNFHVKKKDLIARGQANDALAKANEHLTSGSGGASSSAMDKLEQKILEKELRNEAVNSLRDQPLVDELKILENSSISEVDMELEALKAQMASRPALSMDRAGAGTPKLIESADATVVEEVEDSRDSSSNS